MENYLKVIKIFYKQQYKDFLQTTNGCYLFDLISIRGKDILPRKGISQEERVNGPVHVNSFEYLLKKPLSDDLFLFAGSMITISGFAFNKNENVVQIDYRKSNIIRVFETLDELLRELLVLGTRMVKIKNT